MGIHDCPSYHARDRTAFPGHRETLAADNAALEIDDLRQ
jgi:hypothetical protein